MGGPIPSFSTRTSEFSACNWICWWVSLRRHLNIDGRRRFGTRVCDGTHQGSPLIRSCRQTPRSPPAGRLEHRRPGRGRERAPTVDTQASQIGPIVSRAPFSLPPRVINRRLKKANFYKTKSISQTSGTNESTSLLGGWGWVVVFFPNMKGGRGLVTEHLLTEAVPEGPPLAVVAGLKFKRHEPPARPARLQRGFKDVLFSASF